MRRVASKGPSPSQLRGDTMQAENALEPVLREVLAPSADEIDRTGSFPREAVDALGCAGLLGLVSAEEVGGAGAGPAAAAAVVRRTAAVCGSTAMVLSMHYVAAAVIECHGPRRTREAIAAGEHLTTLAFSESGSRSHFWAPVGTATADGDAVRLDAQKSWVTSAGEADSYVWSSQPLAAGGTSTLWLVPANHPGLKVAGPFDGLGLRGNASSPVTTEAVRVPPTARLGDDGGGFELMMGLVLPWFAVLNAGASLGMMDAITEKTAAHAGRVRFAHRDERLADLPTIRAYVARMRVATDQVAALVADAAAAVEGGREDASLAVMEAKAAAGESATYVADLGMRVCGGAAFSKDVGVERHFRDARAATVMAPTTDALYDFIGRAVCGLPVFE